MLSTLKGYRAFYPVVKNAFRTFLKELRYYFSGKIKKPVAKDNQILLLRKRTHHLERYLFKPEAYGASFATQVAAEMETYISKLGDAVPENLRAWSVKMLREYHSAKPGCCGCKTVNEGVHPVKRHMDSKTLMRLIRSRRTKRFWRPDPLTDEQRRVLTEAALHTPSSCNRQSLDLIFVEEPELKSFIASTVPGGKQFFNDAPAIIVIVSDARDYRYPDDRTVPYAEAGAAIQNMSLVCESMGLGCCWGSYTSFGGVGEEQTVRSRLAIPDTHIIVASLAVGRSDQFVCIIPRDNPGDRFGINGYKKKV